MRIAGYLASMNSNSGLRLYAIGSPVVMEQLQTRANQAVAHVLAILLLEKASPFTQNTHYLSEKRDAHLAQYKRARGVPSQKPVCKPTRLRSECSSSFRFISKLGPTMGRQCMTRYRCSRNSGTP